MVGVGSHGWKTPGQEVALGAEIRNSLSIVL